MSSDLSQQSNTSLKKKPILLRLIIWLSFLAILMMIIFMIFGYLDNRPEAESSLPAPITVSVSQLQNEQLQPSFEFIGEVRAKQLAQVSAEIASVRILTINKEVGQSVQKGDLLATLDNESLSYQKEQAQSTYEQALDEYNRKSRLGINGGISQEELTLKRIALKSAKAALDDAILRLSKSQLISPVDGIVIARNKDVGTLTAINEAMFTIAVNKEIEFVANIPENQLSQFNLDQSVTLFLSGNNEPVTGKVSRIEPFINTSTRTANLFIEFDEKRFFPIGLFGTAKINLPIQEGITTPTTAILLDELGQYLWYVDNDNRVKKIYVKEVLRQDNKAIIVSDDSLNATLLKNNQEKIIDLSQVKILLKAGSLVNEGDIVSPQLNQKTTSTPDKSL